MPFRILPLLVAACAVLLLVRAAEVADRRQELSSMLLADPLMAEESASKEKDEKPSGEKKDGRGSEKAEGKEDKKEEGKKEKDEADEQEEKDIGRLREGQTEFTQAEVEILQRLSERRKKLDEWAGDLSLKENVLTITQTKIDQKIGELRTLKKAMEDLLAQYNAKEDEKIGSLVKIYENMKPQSAAKIFSEMDIATLLPVVQKMKEAKIAPIFAAMDPKSAKKLTTSLANFRTLGRIQETEGGGEDDISPQAGPGVAAGSSAPLKSPLEMLLAPPEPGKTAMPLAPLSLPDPDRGSQLPSQAASVPSAK